jgi:hypothetical protein
MLMITVITLILVLTFCILPTLICMTVGICLYYCLREDPIPLSVLLRYLLSPDDDLTDYPSSYAIAQRPVIASKLIVRRVLAIEKDPIKEEDENSQKEKNNQYPRRHPHPIKLWTDSSCIHFSEPVTIVDKDTASMDENNNDHYNHHSMNHLGGETLDDIHGSTGGGSSNTTILPHYQRSDDYYHTPPNRSIRSLQSSMAQHLPNPMEPSTLIDDDGNAGISNSHSNATPMPYPPAVDIESGIHVNDTTVGGAQDVDETGLLHDEKICIPCHREEGQPDVKVSSSSEELLRVGTEPPPPPLLCAETTTGVAEDLDASSSVGADYFGIHAEVRDRGTTCDICLLEYEVGDTVAWSPNMACSHAFHRYVVVCRFRGFAYVSITDARQNMHGCGK